MPPKRYAPPRLKLNDLKFAGSTPGRSNSETRNASRTSLPSSSPSSSTIPLQGLVTGSTNTANALLFDLDMSDPILHQKVSTDDEKEPCDVHVEKQRDKEVAKDRAESVMDSIYRFSYQDVSDDDCEKDKGRQNLNDNKHTRERQPSNFNYNQLRDAQVRNFASLVSSAVAEAEEEHLIQSLQQSIDDSRDEQFFTSLQERIHREAKQWDAPSGRVQMVDRDPVPNQQISPEQAQEEWEWDSHHKSCPIGEPKPTVARGRGQKKILEMDFLGNDEVVVTKVLPKYMPFDDEPLFSEVSLEERVTAAQHGSLEHPASINIQDSILQPNSIVMEVRGSRNFISVVQQCVTDIILERQMTTKHMTRAMSDRPQKKKRKRSREQTPTKSNKKGVATAEKLTKGFQDSYSHFCRKYYHLKQFEFKGTGIHEQKINKYLWRQHKTNFSDSCSSNCTCAFNLGLLCRNVIPSYIKDQKKVDPDFSQKVPLPEDETGFATRFANKFIGRLREEFHSETPEQIYRRLVRMFEEHRKQMQFGDKCSPGCTCEEAWEFVFLKGALDEKGDPQSAQKKPGKRKQTLPKPDESPVQLGRPTTSPQILRNLMALNPKVTSIPRAPSMTKDQNPPSLVSNIIMNTAAENLKKTPKRSSLSSTFSHQEDREVSFDVEFKTTDQLGFFCVDKTREATRSDKVQKPTWRKNYCVIASVNPIGIAFDSRIWAGTIIAAVKNNATGKFHAVESFQHVKDRFRTAQDQNETLVLELRNPRAMTKFQRSQRDDWTTQNEWTASGDRRYGNGWPGNAPLAHRCVESFSFGHDHQSGVVGKQTLAAKKSLPSSKQGQTIGRNVREEESPNRIAWGQDASAGSAYSVVPQAYGGHAGLERSVSLGGTSEEKQSVATASKAKVSDLPKVHNRTAKPKKSILRPPKIGKPGYAEKNIDTGKDTGKYRGVADILNMEKRTKPILVKFRNVLSEVRLYDVHAKVANLAEVPVESERRAQLSATRVQKTKTLFEELMQAISLRKCKLVYDVLMKGCNPDPPDNARKKPLKLAKEKKDSTKSELERAKAVYEGDRSERNRMAIVEREKEVKQARVIETLLKIFKQVNIVVRMCQELKHWQVIHVDILSISNLVFRQSMKDRSGNVTLSVRRKKRILEPQTKLPVTGDQSYLEMPQRRVYRLVYNKWFEVDENGNRIGREDDEIIFKLEFEDDSGGEKFFLGEIAIALAELVSRKGGKTVVDFEPTSALETAFLALACRSEKPKELVDEQKALCYQNFDQVMNDIKCFGRDETRREIGVPDFGFNIKSCHHPYLTPLHAAIYLHDPKLIQALLDHGARSNAKSKVGTPKALTESLLEGLTRKNKGDDEVKYRDRLSVIYQMFGGSLDGLGEFDRNDEPDGKEGARQDTGRKSVTDGFTYSETSVAATVGPKSSKFQTRRDETAVPGADQPSQAYQREATFDRDDYDSSRRVDNRGKEDEQQTTLRGRSLRDEHTAARHPRKDQYRNYTRRGRELPRVSRAWFSNEQECWYFPRKSGCRFGLSCRHIHVAPKFGPIVDESERLKHLGLAFNDNDIFKFCEVDSEGHPLYTAAVFDRPSRVYVKAEGGYAEGEQDGTFWYNESRDAVDAALQALVVYQNQHVLPVAQSREALQQPSRWSKSFGGEKSGAFSYQGVSSEYPAFREQRKTAAGDNLFFLLKKSDLSEVFKKITEVGMDPKNWKLEEKNSMGRYYFAALTVQVDGIFDRAETFVSSLHGEGTRKMDGRWFHTGSNSAKASAFVKFMERCEDIGLVSEVNGKKIGPTGHPLPLGRRKK